MEKDRNNNSNNFENFGDDQEKLYWYFSSVKEKRKRKNFHFHGLLYLIITLLALGFLILIFFGVNPIFLLIIVGVDLLFIYFEQE